MCKSRLMSSYRSHAFCILQLCLWCRYLDFTKPVVNNMLFWSLALAQLWHSFNLSRGNTFIFKNEIFRNKYVWFALIICLLVMFATYAVIPFRNVFRLIPLNVLELSIILVTSILPVIIIQVLKKLKLVI